MCHRWPVVQHHRKALHAKRVYLVLEEQERVLHTARSGVTTISNVTNSHASDQYMILPLLRRLARKR